MCFHFIVMVYQNYVATAGFSAVLSLSRFPPARPLAFLKSSCFISPSVALILSSSAAFSAFFSCANLLISNNFFHCAVFLPSSVIHIAHCSKKGRDAPIPIPGLDFDTDSSIWHRIDTDTWVEYSSQKNVQIPKHRYPFDM